MEWDRLLSFNGIYVKRLARVAVIPRAMAVDYGLVGPNLRGSAWTTGTSAATCPTAPAAFRFEVPVARLPGRLGPG